MSINPDLLAEGLARLGRIADSLEDIARRMPVVGQSAGPERAPKYGRRDMRQGVQLDEHLDQAMDEKFILIYTDGSGINAGSAQKSAGAGAIAIFGNTLKGVAVPIPNGTNNIGELEAIRQGLMLSCEIMREVEKSLPVVLVSDSQYALGVGLGEMNAKANLELVESIRGLAGPMTITPKWVRGHASNPANDLVDFLAYNGSLGRSATFTEDVIVIDDVTAFKEMIQFS